MTQTSRRQRRHTYSFIRFLESSRLLNLTPSTYLKPLSLGDPCEGWLQDDKMTRMMKPKRSKTRRAAHEQHRRRSVQRIFALGCSKSCLVAGASLRRLRFLSRSPPAGLPPFFLLSAAASAPLLLLARATRGQGFGSGFGSSSHSRPPRTQSRWPQPPPRRAARWMEA